MTNPAGNYDVNRDPSNGILRFEGTSGLKDSQLLILSYRTESAQVHKSITLVFDQVGSRRYLSEVRYPGQTSFWVFSMAKKDSQMAKKDDTSTVAAPKTE